MTNQQQINNFIGQGIILPLVLENGKAPIKGGFDLLRASIIMILSWKYGTRFFLNEFGSKLENLLEEPNDAILENTIRVFIIDAINKWDPRIKLVDSIMERPNNWTINLTITYQILNIKQEDTFTFPFYSKIIY